MTSWTDPTRLRHMHDHSLEAMRMARSHARSGLDVDRKLNLAFVRLVVIIGEAAPGVSQEERARRQGIPWAEIVGMRNRVVHGYFQIDFDLLWDVIQLDLPPAHRATGTYFPHSQERSR